MLSTAIQRIAGIECGPNGEWRFREKTMETDLEMDGNGGMSYQDTSLGGMSYQDTSFADPEPCPFEYDMDAVAPPASAPAASLSTAMSAADAHKNKMKREQRKQVKAAQSEAHIQWGTVDTHFFTKQLAYSAVPNKGLYPVALGLEMEDLFLSVPVEEHCAMKQADLLHRAQKMGIKTPLIASPSAAPAPSVPIPIPKKDGANSSTRTATTATTIGVSPLFTPPPVGQTYAHLETRQFDYRRGEHNLLFSALTEEERKLLLELEASRGAPGLHAVHSSITPPRSSMDRQHSDKFASVPDAVASSGSLGKVSFTPPRGGDVRKARSNMFDVGSSNGNSSSSNSNGNSSTHHIAELHKEIKAIQKARSANIGITLALSEINPHNCLL